MALEEGGEEGEVAVTEDEYVAVFLGHTLTPPLVEATIMVSVSWAHLQHRLLKIPLWQVFHGNGIW